jgi:membrane protease YdiL (CAAX protease family)
VVPGLLLILGLEVMVLLGFIQYTPRLQFLFTATMLLIPWITTLLSDNGLESLGYTRERLWLHIGWGMVAGGFWRILSVIINLWGLELNGVWTSSRHVLAAVLWVPFLEETFFRAYLGRSLTGKFGAVMGILIQATLFTLLPSHTQQGVWSLMSIFAFGLLAGWLMKKRQSIWAPWGAHAFANLLPILVLIVY